jgi:hypothetical protein
VTKQMGHHFSPYFGNIKRIKLLAQQKQAVFSEESKTISTIC